MGEFLSDRVTASKRSIESPRTVEIAWTVPTMYSPAAWKASLSDIPAFPSFERSSLRLAITRSADSLRRFRESLADWLRKRPSNSNG